MLQILAYSAAEGLREDVTVDRLRDLLQQKDRFVWLNFSHATREEFALLSSLFNFHPLALEDCEARRHHPKIDDYGSYLFILSHGVHPESSTREFRTRQLSLFVGPNYVVSFHKERSRSVEYALDLARRNPKVMSDGPGAVLYNILDFQVDQYLPVVDNFQKRTDELETRVLSRPTSEILNEVFEFKRAIMRLRRIAGHQRGILLRLTRREFALVDERSAINLRDVYDNLVRVTDLAEAYRELVVDALSAHLSIVANRTNEAMRVLTIIATLFIPLTFIVGVYGMNFDVMPELHWKYGYLFVWILMVGIAAGTFWFFRRRGVFERPDR